MPGRQLAAVGTCKYLLEGLMRVSGLQRDFLEKQTASPSFQKESSMPQCVELKKLKRALTRSKKFLRKFYHKEAWLDFARDHQEISLCNKKGGTCKSRKLEEKFARCLKTGC